MESASSPRGRHRPLAAVVALLTCLIGAPARAATPVPSVNGPLPNSAQSHPFGGAAYTMHPQDLAKLGYVEEEYLISGQANVYDWPAPGPAVVRTPDAPYTTRVLVRRPVNPRKFSGNIIVEPLNPSNLFDLNIGWGVSGEHLVRNGDVWVGVTVKPVSVVALKNFDPARYAALNFANPLPLDDPRNCATVPADSSRSTENGLAWDIISQTGAWLKSQDASNPLRAAAGYQLRHLIGFGYSRPVGTSTTTSTASIRWRRPAMVDSPCTTPTSSRWPVGRLPGCTRSTSASLPHRCRTRVGSSATWACRSSTSCPNRII